MQGLQAWLSKAPSAPLLSSPAENIIDSFRQAAVSRSPYLSVSYVLMLGSSVVLYLARRTVTIRVPPCSRRARRQTLYVAGCEV